MTEEGALLAAIRECPGEDTPRLAYADWLDENPTPKRRARAEFVRVQVEATTAPTRITLGTGTLVRQLPDGRTVTWPGSGATGMLTGTLTVPNARVGELKARETALLKKWGMAWLPQAVRQVAGDQEHARWPIEVDGNVIKTGLGIDVAGEFRRGFLYRLGVLWQEPQPFRFQSAQPFLKYAVPVLAASPCEVLEFAFVNHLPTVRLRVQRDDRGWYATLDEQPGVRVGRGAATDSYHTRRELLCDTLPTFLAEQIPQIEFTHVPPTIPF